MDLPIDYRVLDIDFLHVFIYDCDLFVQKVLFRAGYCYKVVSDSCIVKSWEIIDWVYIRTKVVSLQSIIF